MFTVRIEDNIRQWHRLTRHLNHNHLDPCLCLLNPVVLSDSSSHDINEVIVYATISRSPASVVTKTDNTGERPNDCSCYVITKPCCDVSETNIVISPWLLHNRLLKNNPCIETVNVSFEIVSVEDTSTAPASEVLFHLIRSYDYHVEIDFSVSLKAFFTDHRIYLDPCVCEGDVIEVNVCDLDRRRHFSEYGTEPNNIAVRILKIGKAVGNHYLHFIDPSETHLRSLGVVRDFIPRLSFSSKLDEEPFDFIDDQFQRGSRAVSFAMNRWKDVGKTNYGLLLRGKHGYGQSYLLQRLARRFSLNIVPVYPHEMLSVAYSTSTTLIRSHFATLSATAPSLVVLYDLHRIIQSRENAGKPDAELSDAIISEWTQLKDTSSEFPIVICATIPSDSHLDAGNDMDNELTMNDSDDYLPPRLLRLFIEHLHFSPLERKQREAFFTSLCERRYITLPQRLMQYLSQRTAGLTIPQIKLLVDKLVSANIDISDDTCDVILEEVFKLSGRQFRPADIPNVSWEDIGGLKEVIDEIVNAVNLTSSGMNAGGILLYGPPGTGKTLLAKAVAKECNMNFIGVKGPELLNMYVGQSEANVRDLFKRAREAAPCIIFCDELDSLAPKRGRTGDSGGVMDRVVSQLMSEMEASTEKSAIQIIGATNRPDLLDEALLRPGRFDRLIYVSVSSTLEKHAAIFRAQARNFPVPSPGEPGSLNVDEIVSEMPKHVTGADVYAVCSEAWRIAVSRYIDDIENSEKEQTSEFLVYHEDFMIAARNLIPSISSNELQRYEVIRSQFL